MASLTEMFFTDGETDTTVRWNGVLTSVYVSHIRTGITAVGHAKHDPEDIYDHQVGMDLAMCRAMSRMYKKMERAVVRATK